VTSYVLLKAIHVVSSTILFGTGLGTAFFKWIVDRAGNVAAIRDLQRSDTPHRAHTCWHG
jgi:uncharacterized membrane protein